MPQDKESQPGDATLGSYLALLRKASGLSLRQVEERSEGEVSNAYLSQLENGKIVRPSPNILEALSRVYKAPYQELMRRAGYLSRKSDRGGRTGRVVAFSIQDLTRDEEEELIRYLAYIRQNRK